VATKKKQHYVPRFYLKNFSWEDRNTINIFNIKGLKNISNGNLYNQCYGNNFYGKDIKVEDALGLIEGATASIINQILTTKSIPGFASEEHCTLIAFVVFQHSRTKYAAIKFNQMADRFAKLVLRHEGSVDKSVLDKVTISFNNAPHLLVGSAGEMIPLVYDLRCKLIVNKSMYNFITSDNPVVLYNQYMHQSKYGSALGLASEGLQIFLPLTSKVMLLFYDSNVYRVGSSASQICEIYSKPEVIKLNELQWLNALENIYYSKTMPGDEIDRQASRLVPLRSGELISLDEINLASSNPDQKKLLFHSQEPRINVLLKPSFIKIKRIKARILCNSRAVNVRDPYLVEMYKKFQEEVKSKRYKPSQFLEYVINNLGGKCSAL